MEQGGPPAPLSPVPLGSLQTIAYIGATKDEMPSWVCSQTLLEWHQMVYTVLSFWLF